ncbi:(R)-specific enoyl-CoA hydratase-like [Hetaerina americana]|uniref:(R)-specific enoyl-CoA hydratase-like n=1 Tax=Hetaerina americana TaxID=62018 RepID=UPI003A7F4FFF
MFPETGHRTFATGPVPSLFVGEKAVVSMAITSDMVKCFAQATGDWNPIHFEAGNLDTKSEKCDGRKDNTNQLKKVPIVHGALLNGIVSGVIGTRLPGPGTVVVSQVFKFAAPLPVGGQVSVEVEVMNFRRREVNVKYKIVSIPDETVVMDGTARLLVPRDRIGKVS